MPIRRTRPSVKPTPRPPQPTAASLRRPRTRPQARGCVRLPVAAAGFQSGTLAGARSRRLAAVDITNPQTWNRYAYVGNNPLSATDPLGLNPWDGRGGVRGGFLVWTVLISVIGSVFHSHSPSRYRLAPEVVAAVTGIHQVGNSARESSRWRQFGRRCSDVARRDERHPERTERQFRRTAGSDFAQCNLRRHGTVCTYRNGLRSGWPPWA